MLWAIRRWLEEHEHHKLNGAARWRTFLGPTFIQDCGAAADEAADAMYALLIHANRRTPIPAPAPAPLSAC